MDITINTHIIKINREIIITTKIKNIISEEILKNNTKINLIIAYVPNFNKILAKIMEPGVGASTWASGNQTCKGIIGIFTPNPINKKNNKINCLLLNIYILDI